MTDVPVVDLGAVIAGELSALAVDAKTLASRLEIGDVVRALVLPSNGLTDLLDIDGLRVAAELPPTLLPGQTITVKVEGLRGDRINLQIVPGAAEAPSTPRGRLVRGQGVRASSAPTRLVAAAQSAIEARLAASHALAPAGGRSTAPLATATLPLRPPIVARQLALAIPQAGPGPRTPAAFAQPATLLRALRLPTTATNLSLARLALDAPQKLPGALAALERALSDTDDARLVTLRTLISFLARLEPQSPVLSTQIAAYVDHLVTGQEVKLGELLRGIAAESPAFAAERTAGLRAALDGDVKTQLFELAAGDVSQPPTPLDDAIAGALVAITAVQLEAARALANAPDGIAWTIPIALPDGTAHAFVRIDRETPNTSRVPLDGENFHLGFVLETRRLGTVAIDLTTLGRAVRIAVKTENLRVQRIFADALAGLCERLVKLQYTISEASASVAPVALAPPPPPSSDHRVDRAQRVDVDA